MYLHKAYYFKLCWVVSCATIEAMNFSFDQDLVHKVTIPSMQKLM